MEKQRVNDAVVKLSNLISKARVFVIRRLSAKTRALRQKINRECHQRITRWLLEIAYLKTLSKSGTRKMLARRILVNTDDHDAMIEHESTTPEDRAFYRLCKTKFIVKFVTKFREENVDWKYWVPPLLAMWDKKIALKFERGSKKTTADQANRVSVKALTNFIEGKREPGSIEAPESSSRAAKLGSDLNKSLEGNVEQKKQKPSLRIEKRKSSRIEQHSSTYDANQTELEDSDSLQQHAVERSLNNDSEGESDSIKPQKILSKGKTSNRLLRFHKNRDRDTTKESYVVGGKRELCQVPFRPYAPRYFVGNSESDRDSDEDEGDEVANDDDNNDDNNRYDAGDDYANYHSGDASDDHDESSKSDKHVDTAKQDENYSGTVETADSEDSTSEGMRMRSEGLTVRNLEASSDSDERALRDTADSDEESEMERERAFEARTGAAHRRTSNAQNSTYEPDSSEEEFSNQENSSESDGEKTYDKSSDSPSFFLKKGEKPQTVQPRTIPKERAPGLNRRQRRGHEKQRAAHVDSHSDDAEASQQPNLLFGKQFRTRKRREDNSGQHLRRNDMRRASSTRSSRCGSLGTSLSVRFQNSPSSSSLSGSMNYNENVKFRKGSNASRFQGERYSNSFSKGSRSQPERRFSERDYRSLANKSDRRQANKRDENVNNSHNYSGKRSSQVDMASEEKLHPSWSAKRRIAASINQPFQGKRIVFDD